MRRESILHIPNSGGFPHRRERSGTVYFSASAVANCPQWLMKSKLSPILPAAVYRAKTEACGRQARRQSPRDAKITDGDGAVLLRSSSCAGSEGRALSCTAARRPKQKDGRLYRFGSYCAGMWLAELSEEEFCDVPPTGINSVTATYFYVTELHIKYCFCS